MASGESQGPTRPPWRSNATTAAAAVCALAIAAYVVTHFGVLATIYWAGVAVLALFGLLGASIYRTDLADKRRDRRFAVQGYGAILKGVYNDGDSVSYIEYSEGAESHFLICHFEGRQLVVPVPDAESWPTSVPPWMINRRELLLSRIRQEIPRVRFVETAAPLEELGRVT